jgi:hypothetical protein
LASLHFRAVGAWYTIGLFAGLGTAIGVVLAGALASVRVGPIAAVLVGIAAGVVLGIAVADVPEGTAAAVGAAFGAYGASQIARGALRRGGTPVATAALVAVAALVVAALAFVPLLGYVEAVALPGLAARLRRRSPETYAGLRMLARD